MLDRADPERLAAFWAAALDDVNGPKLILQQVADAKTVKNRIHPNTEGDH